jgi:hypothetical protein
MAEMNVSPPERMKDWVKRDALVGALIEGEASGTSSRTLADIAAAAKSKLLNGGI